MNRFKEILVTIFIFVFVFFIYKDQKRNTLNGGKGYDGTEYYETALQYTEGKNVVSGSLPFIKRLGTPFFVSLLSVNTNISILDSALIINLIAAFIIAILNILWLRLFVKSIGIRFLINIVYLLGWANALRYSFFYPMNSDSWGVVFLLLGLIIIYKIKEAYQKNENREYLFLILLFSMDVFVSIFFRESNIILAVALLFILEPLYYIKKDVFNLENYIYSVKKIINIYSNKKSLLLFIPLLVGICANIFILKLVNIQDNGYSYLYTVLKFIYQKSLPEYLLAVFISYGPMFVIILFYFKNWVEFFKHKQELLFILFSAFTLGLIGGSGTERILYNISYPIVFIMIAEAFSKIYYTKKRWWLYILLILQIVAYRVLWYTPDYENGFKPVLIPFFTLLGNRFGFLLLFSSYGKDLQNVIIFIEYCILIIITGFVLENNSNFKNLLKYKKN